MTLKNQNRTKILLKNTLIISFGTFFPKLMAIISLPILTMKLTTSEFGTYDLIDTLISLLLPLVTLQISSAGFRFIIQERNNKEECKKIISNIFIVIAISILISSIILFFIFKNINFLLIFFVIIYFILDILNVSISQIVRGFSKNLIYTFSTIIASIFKTILIFLLLIPINLGLLGTIIALTISTLASLIYMCYKIKIWQYIDLKLISAQTLKKLLSYSWPMIPNNLSGWILNTSDRLIITVFLGIEQNAIYAVANKIPNLLSTFNSSFTMAWQENASLNSNDKDIDVYYTTMFESFIRFIAGGCSLIIATTPALFWLLIKGNYANAYFQMPILFIAIFYSCLSSFLGGIYIAGKRTKSVGITTIIAAIINLMIDLIFVKKIGITAGSISTLASYIFIVYYRMINLKKYHNLKYNKKLIFIVNFILLFMSIICFINNTYLNFINVIIGIFFCYILNKRILINIKNKILIKLRRRKFDENC